MTWPSADLDPVRRARILAGALPGAASTETVIDAPFERTWDYVLDLERSIPSFDSTVRRVRLRHQDDRSASLVAYTGPVRVPIPFDVDLEPGWCLMRGRWRSYLVCMAAVPEGDRTRFVHVEAVPLPGGRLARPYLRHHVEHDLRTLAGLIVKSS